MNKPNRFLLSLASSALFCGLAVTAGAQQAPDQQTSPSTPSAQQPTPDQQTSPSTPSAQQPNETPQNPPAQAPSQTAPSQQPSQPSQSAPDSSASSSQTTGGGQVFSGTVTKAGDKYVLQAADGTAYNIDHQDLVQKYEGKQVRVKGTLDADGKTIHITQ